MIFNQDTVNRDLREVENSKFQGVMLSLIRDYLRLSAAKMSRYWTSWDEHEKTYRGFKFSDKEDDDQQKKGRPPKIIIPVAYAQTQTAVAFILSLYNQRKNLFELEGRGPEDVVRSKGLEYDLSYQTQRDRFFLTLYCWLLDACRYGIGITKCQWVEEHEMVRVMQSMADNITSFGQAQMGLTDVEEGQETGEQLQEAVERVISYQGNRVQNVSPFSFLPDPNVNLAQFQDGMFCAHEETVSKKALKYGESEGIYHGVKHVPDQMQQDIFQQRTRRIGIDSMQHGTSFTKIPHTSFIATELVLDVIPKEMTETYDLDAELIGDEDHPVKFLAVVANDQKLIRFERMRYNHSRFPYNVIEFNPDSNSFWNPGMSDTIQQMQGLMTWFLNSHVNSVSRMIKNRLLVNQDLVEVSDIENDRIVIRTKAGKAVRDLGGAIKQIDLHDVTQGHVRDMETLMKLMQVVTSVSDNALGQYAPGRRSATESRNVNQGIASRLKMHAQLGYYQGIEPLGEMMIANTRQWREEPVYNAILGDAAARFPFDQVILATPGHIVGGYDFAPFDAVSPSEKMAIAHQLQEVFTMLLQGPELAQILDLDVKALFEHFMELLGIKHLDEFRQVPQMEVADPTQMAEGGQPVDNVFGEDLLRQIATGTEG